MAGGPAAATPGAKLRRRPRNGEVLAEVWARSCYLKNTRLTAWRSKQGWSPRSYDTNHPSLGKPLGRIFSPMTPLSSDKWPAWLHGLRGALTVRLIAARAEDVPLDLRMAAAAPDHPEQAWRVWLWPARNLLACPELGGFSFCYPFFRVDLAGLKEIFDSLDRFELLEGPGESSFAGPRLELEGEYFSRLVRLVIASTPALVDPWPAWTILIDAAAQPVEVRPFDPSQDPTPLVG